jgi:hypothetical protein
MSVSTADALTTPINAAPVAGPVADDPRAAEEASRSAAKRCPSCKRVKPVTDFGRAASRADGLRRECKACNCAASKRSRDKKRLGVSR